MDPFQLRQALAEVRNLRRNILEKQLYKGYSGRARALGGGVALAASAYATFTPLQLGERELFILWGGVYLCALLLNYGAVATWILRNGNFRRSDHTVVFEMVPTWIVGAVLTLALWQQGQADLLYGTWMALFGLSQGMPRLRLPRRMAWVGAWYIACGVICLAFPTNLFAMPLIMGLVFFIGEFSAGLIMHNSHHGNGVAGFMKMESSHE